MWCCTPCVAAGRILDGFTTAGNCLMSCWNTDEGPQVATCEATAADREGAFTAAGTEVGFLTAAV